MRPRFANNTPRNRGSRECRVRDAPAVSRAKSRKHTRSSPQVHRSNRHSPRNGFNGLLRDLPGDRALLSPSFSEYGWSAPGRADVASAKLDASVEASGPHDFTVRISAVRLRACKSLTGWTPPCDSRLRADAAASTASLPNVRDGRETPLSRAGTAQTSPVICLEREGKYFLNRGWTSQTGDLPVRQNRRAKHAPSAAQHKGRPPDLATAQIAAVIPGRA